MSEARKIWATVSGSYSDYRVGVLFETEGDAQAYVDAGFDEDIEEFWLHPAGYRPKITLVYHAAWNFGPWFGPDVKISEERRIDDDGEVARKLSRPDIKADPRFDFIGGECTDRDLLAKAMQDRIYQHRAIRAGIA